MRGFEAAVVVAGAQLVEEPRPRAARARAASAPSGSSPLRDGRERGLDAAARLAQRPGRRVDRERGFVAEQVPGHRAEHEREVGVHDGNRDRVDRGREPVLAVVDDHDRRRLVRAVDRDLLGDVVGVRAAQAGRAHEDHRLGREVDVLLVLGDVARDRLVTELRELDPHLVRGDAVRAVADDRPRTPAQRVALRGRADRGAPADQLEHRVGQLAQRDEPLVAVRRPLVVVVAELGRDREREQEARPRPASRTPWSTRRSSRRRARRR